MVDALEALVEFCTEPLVLVRTELPSRSHHARFEIDYEANMALFLAANFSTGDSSAPRSRFSNALKQRLQWSRVYRDLLDDRLMRQPSFDLADFRVASPHGRWTGRPSLRLHPARRSCGRASV